ncbi:MAG: 30S ribosomal protein S4 [Candidatus Moraniibacteriota bacterium]|nr:MAG: 30S ribosomal protein S4 [Candidatus Moranbacteria bacterium]
MARNLDKCRLCRRAGEKLFLKGERCFSPKCALTRKAYAPGVHGKTVSRSQSEYGKQLAMKQRIKRIYGILEKQFRKHYEDVRRRKGVTGDLLLARLEMRLDSVVYRLGFASSRALARQLVSHRAFLVNGKPLSIPSAEIKVGDVVTLASTKAEKNYFLHKKTQLSAQKNIPGWLEARGDKFEGKVIGLPTRNDIGVSVDPQSVVEYYSK